MRPHAPTVGDVESVNCGVLRRKKTSIGVTLDQEHRNPLLLQGTLEGATEIDPVSSAVWRCVGVGWLSSIFDPCELTRESAAE